MEAAEGQAAGRHDDVAHVAALLSIGRRRLSSATCLTNTASFIFYGITCLTLLIDFAALFATFEENLR